MAAAKETGLSEVSLYFCNADPVETSVPQFLMNECKRLDSPNIIKVWWRSNPRLPSWICQKKKSQQGILKSCLKAWCSCSYVVDFSVFLTEVTQEIPIQTHAAATFQPPTSASKRRSETSLLCDKYTHNIVKTLLDSYRTALEGRYQLSHLLNWLQNWRL